jgi:hypothetical protein
MVLYDALSVKGLVLIQNLKIILLFKRKNSPSHQIWLIYLVSICSLLIDGYDNDVLLDQQTRVFPSFCSTFGVAELIDDSQTFCAIQIHLCYSSKTESLNNLILLELNTTINEAEL